MPYKCLRVDYMLFFFLLTLLILVIDELLMLTIFFYYFVISLLIKITLISGPRPSKHDYVLGGVSVPRADVPKAVLAAGWQEAAAAARECLIVIR